MPDARLRIRRYVYAVTTRAGAFAWCLRGRTRSCTVRTVNALEGKLVMVPADQLDDLLELTRLASDRLGDDQLSRSLRAAASNVRLSQLVEP